MYNNRQIVNNNESKVIIVIVRSIISERVV